LHTVSPEVVYASDHLLIQCHNPDADRAVVTFDFRHIRDGGFTVLKPSIKVQKSGQAYITVATKRNDWFLSESLSDCKDHVADFTKKFSRVVGFGSSMGGYGALALSRPFRFNQVLIVSPQATPFPDEPPFDRRFSDHVAGLDRAHDTMLKNPRKGLGGVLLFDPAIQEDHDHARLITNAFPRIKTCAFCFAGHPALGPFVAAEKFGEVQAELIENRISASRLLRRFKSLRRSSEIYQTGLNAYLKQRQARAGKNDGS
jgi:hypothetical protein